ncbi:MAG: NUDIX domain-containing protein [Candidatus Pacebacteria bacterium]|nr:NUDIX domain-containing protein [Candidatus Paceibacterota bacterium]
MDVIIIVDDEDNIIGTKERESITEKDLYRVSVLWVTNSKDEILLAKRSLNKTNSPGKWGPAVTGTVEENETYDLNMIKEAEEEIGLKNIIPQKGIKIRMATKYNYFCQWYSIKIDRNLDEFRIKKSEVEEIKWFLREELSHKIDENRDEFILSVRHGLKMF